MKIFSPLPVSLISLALLGGPLATAALSWGAPSTGASNQEEAKAEEEEEKVSWEGKTVEEMLGEITKFRDEVDEGVIPALRDVKTREAMEALLKSYETFGSTYMRLKVTRSLGEFDDVDDAFEPALEKLMNVATNESARELRAAALDTLGGCSSHGKRFLELIVESPAEDATRETALEKHIRLGTAEDNEWYKKLYERTMEVARKEASGGGKKKKKKKKKKKGEEETEERVPISWPTPVIRGRAMEAIMDTLEDGDLQKAFEEDRSMTVRRTALSELASRGSKKAPEYANEIIERVDAPGTDRALAVEILVKDQGADAAKGLIKLATKPITPEVLRQRIADVLAELKDEDVDKQLLKLVGKGKGPQQTFAIRATKLIEDEKHVKKMRKGLKSKEVPIVLATIHAIAARKDKEALKDMEKLLEKTKIDEIREAALQGLSSLYDGENAWVDRLIDYAGREEIDLRNAALTEIARLGRSNTIDLFKERLSHTSWATRLIALRALADQKDAALLRPIVDQMMKESGRMEVEFGSALFRLTGKPFGRRAATWDRWLKDTAEDEIEILDDDELEDVLAAEEERRLKQISNAAFFGIRIESHRVLFIIDVSGSMAETVRARYVGEQGKTRMEVAKIELKKAIEALDEKALFNITPFSGGVESWLEDGVASAADASREEALEFTERLGPNGGTNLYGSLVNAFEDPDVDTIFLLSDGEPSVGDLIDPQLIRDDIAERNTTRGVVINTISIGSSLQVLSWLAEDSGGTSVEIQ